MGSGLAGFPIAMTTFNGELIVAGSFASAGGVTVNNIARWNGASWQPLGSPAGTSSPVFALAVYNNELIACGNFTSAGGAPASRIARWNGSQWQPLGGGLNGAALGLAVLGNNLYVGGDFTLAGSVPNTRGVARWDGQNWHSVAGGNFAGVGDLIIYNNELIAAGVFSINTVGGQSRHIARLDAATQTWHSMQGGFNAAGSPESMTVYNGELYVAGSSLSMAGESTLRGIAKWNGATQQWSKIAPGFDITPSHFTTYRGDLIAAGGFGSAGAVEAKGIARWDGKDWHPLAGGIMDGAVIGVIDCVIEYNNKLIVGGYFSNAGGVQVRNIAAWDGATETWMDLGGGVTGGEIPRVHALAVYNGELIAAGQFSFAGGGSVPAFNVARWDGTQWHAMGAGVGICFSMAEFNGSLYASVFSGSGGMQRWDGAQWHAVPGGFNNFSMTIWNGLLISGFLDPMAYNGSTWTAFPGWSWDPNGAGVGNFEYVVFDGSLVVAGQFENAAGIPEADGLVRFDGTGWHSFATPNGTVASITSGAAVHKGELITNGRVDHPDGTISNWRRFGFRGADAFGVGTPGCEGFHSLEAGSVPSVGNAQFYLSCSKTSANAIGLLLIGNSATIAGADPFNLGLLTYVGFDSTELIAADMFSNFLGDGIAAVPIPPTPALAGSVYFAQALWFWGGACASDSFGLSSSNGLTLTIQQ
jgi:hypothetical protein